MTMYWEQFKQKLENETGFIVEQAENILLPTGGAHCIFVMSDPQNPQNKEIFGYPPDGDSAGYFFS